MVSSKSIRFWCVFLLAVTCCVAVGLSLMERKLEQHAVIKFHVRGGYSQTRTFNELRHVYGDDCLSLTQVKFW